MGMVLYLRAVEPEEPEVLRNRVSDIAGFIFAEEDRSRLVDFDVEWMVLNFVVEPLGNLRDLSRLILFGERADAVSEDLGYGPAWYVGPTKIADFASRLAEFSDAQVKGNYDPQLIADSYLGSYYLENPEKGWEGLSHQVGKLRAFVNRTAEDKFAVVGMVA
jgi:hypothetical protein